MKLWEVFHVSVCSTRRWSICCVDQVFAWVKAREDYILFKDGIHPYQNIFVLRTGPQQPAPKEESLWSEMRSAMMAHSRDFTPEESKAHQRALDSLFVVEEENVFGLR